VGDNRRGLEPATPAGRKSPGRQEAMHVFAGDLIERAIAPGSVISVERQPVLRLLRGMDDAFRRDFLACGACRSQQTEREEKHTDAGPESAATPKLRPRFPVRHVVLHSISRLATVYSGAKYSAVRA